MKACLLLFTIIFLAAITAASNSAAQENGENTGWNGASLSVSEQVREPRCDISDKSTWLPGSRIYDGSGDLKMLEAKAGFERKFS